MTDYSHCSQCGESIDPEVFYNGTDGTICHECWF